MAYPELSGDSDKENTTTMTSQRDSRTQTGPRAALAEIALGKAFRELCISEGSARKSLRNRKGERSERISSRHRPSAAPGAAPLLASPSPQAVQHSSSPISNTAEAPSETNQHPIVSEQGEDDLEQERIPAAQHPSEQPPTSSKRFQAVLHDGDAAPPTSHSAPLDNQADKSDSSFDPDSPLPVSRAPRHSLLLALTTSPVHFDVSSSRSSSGSPSPLKTEPLFAPEYQTAVTPNRSRQTLEAAAFGITETPLGQATSRHRDARTLRKEQATMERQATISNKLNAVSMAMSGLKASGYGASSIEPRSTSYQESPKIQRQYFQVDVEESKTPPGSITKNPVVLEPPCTISPEPEERAPPIVIASKPLRAKSPEKCTTPGTKPVTSPMKSVYGNQSTDQDRSSAIETGLSRIPKSVAPPSQPVFRKPMISGLPVLKPSLLPTKSLPTSATQKTAPPITMNFKAVRPEAALQPDVPRFATPLKGRMPTTLAFRSPAASRIMAATNPTKPMHGRSASVSLASSVSGAVRPVTPGKVRSVSVGESTGPARSELANGSNTVAPSGLVGNGD